MTRLFRHVSGIELIYHGVSYILTGLLLCPRSMGVHLSETCLYNGLTVSTTLELSTASYYIRRSSIGLKDQLSIGYDHV